MKDFQTPQPVPKCTTCGKSNKDCCCKVKKEKMYSRDQMIDFGVFLVGFGKESVDIALERFERNFINP